MKITGIILINLEFCFIKDNELFVKESELQTSLGDRCWSQLNESSAEFSNWTRRLTRVLMCAKSSRFWTRSWWVRVYKGRNYL